MTKDDKQTLEWAHRVGQLSCKTDGWTSDIAWAIRRSIETYVWKNFRLRIRHVPYGGKAAR